MRPVDSMIAALRAAHEAWAADLTDDQRRLVEWWLPFREMDNWCENGMPTYWNTSTEWPGPHRVSLATRRRWWAGRLHGWSCWWCWVDLVPQNFTADHLTPTSRGGADVRENVRPCCVSCNSRKGARTEREYLDDLAASA